MANLEVHLPQKSIHYEIKIETGILDRLAQEINQVYAYKKIVLVTDENVDYYYGKKVAQHLQEAGYELLKIALEPGEQAKSLDNLSYLYSRLIDFNLTRSDLIIAFGGGVIGDLAGYLAASYLRGIAFIQIPTTLLAQVDSSVGGKVAIDLPQGKNLVGAFYHPNLVLIDPNVLKTLTDESFADGMAEVIKYGCIKDINFFQQLESYSSRSALFQNIEAIIERCCLIKRELVRVDEKDTGERMLLNFGHTLGHAIESYYQYNKYTHGQAISIGMVAINALCEGKEISPAGSTERIKALLKHYGLPTKLKHPADYNAILPLIKRDKKNIQNQLFAVVLENIGQARTLDIAEDFFEPLRKEQASI